MGKKEGLEAPKGLRWDTGRLCHKRRNRNGVTKIMGRSRTLASTERVRIFIGIAAALWLVGAIAAVIDGDMLIALSWFCLAAFGALCAGRFVHRSQGVGFIKTVWKIGIASD